MILALTYAIDAAAEPEQWLLEKCGWVALHSPYDCRKTRHAFFSLNFAARRRTIWRICRLLHRIFGRRPPTFVRSARFP